MLSIVIPTFNENANVKLFYDTVFPILEASLVQKDYELIFVDDGSSDDTWTWIRQMPGICRGVRFSRNFGKESAIYAGLLHARGDCCVIMDCDLQHPPEYIPEMYRYYQEGYQIVRCVKETRGEESFLHRLAAYCFYKLFDCLSSKSANINNASDYILISRKVIDCILQFKEVSFFFRGIASSIGFKTKEISFKVAERQSGKSKWSYWKLFKYALNNMTAFSTRPLQIVTIFGVILLVFSFLMIIRTLYVFFASEAAPGVSTIIIMIAFIGSIVMISLGIIGYYIARIYEQTKNRPLFIVEEEK